MQSHGHNRIKFANIAPSLFYFFPPTPFQRLLSLFLSFSPFLSLSLYLFISPPFSLTLSYCFYKEVLQLRSPYLIMFSNGQILIIIKVIYFFFSMYNVYTEHKLFFFLLKTNLKLFK